MSAGADQVSLQPALEEAQRLAADYTLIPLRHEFIDDCETPVSAFLKLRAATPSEPAFLLESAEQGQRMGRYSFIGIRPRQLLRWDLADGGDPYALAAAMLAGLSQAPMEDLPPFAGGLVGYFGYDLVRTVEPLGEPNPDQLGLPDMALMRSDVLVIFDHLRHSLTILVNAVAEEGQLGDASYQEAAATIAEVRALLDGAGLPTSLRGLDVDAVIEATLLDKKRLSGAVPFVCCSDPGEVHYGVEVEPELVRAAVEELAS